MAKLTQALYNLLFYAKKLILGRFTNVVGQTTEKCFDGSEASGSGGQSGGGKKASFVTYKDDNGDYNIINCTQIQVTAHNTNNELYAISFKNANKTYYIDVDLESERQPVQFQGSTLLSYDLKFVESTTPIYINILRLTDDETQLVFKHAQVDAYAFTYALTAIDAYENNQLDNLPKNIVVSNSNDKIIGGIIGGAVAVGLGIGTGVYFYKSTQGPQASEEIELLPRNNSNSFARQVRRLNIRTTECNHLHAD